ncbi:hypothetical protein BDY21DRAFT_209355 [Lineolata rhizophorae]|uniref:Mitochondrial proteins import receptor n=1 Tax=Lineolata rhizophorae TaxID=578093 RepID=A0A6A6P4C5_9PEZI|nr:hypothetical protein BDY21DRAFT_209355 [Lineolata rhizophorae]
MMSASAAPIPTPRPMPVDTSAAASPSLWEKLSNWASEHKVAIYTIAGITVVTVAGAIYYVSDSSTGEKGAESGPSGKTKKKRDRRKAKREEEAAKQESTHSDAKQPSVAAEPEDELPDVTEEIVANLSEQEKNAHAAKLKIAGNKAYGAKEFQRAIDLYGKALLCKQDPVFYSNRAACWSSLQEWEKAVEDTTAAINLNKEYVKALNRRANAYEELGKYSEALLDCTTSCIIDGFRNEQAGQSVERLLKKVAEAKAKTVMQNKEKKLPSPTFVTNYLQSFRPKPLPAGLEESAELDEESGKGQLRKGLIAMGKKTADGYSEASEAFHKALELGGLDEHEALAYNMRGTFNYLKGDNKDALSDITKSIELQPLYTQSYIKRASMLLEQGDRESAAKDFEQAEAQNKNDPDIYYHRAQLHFILQEYSDAARDYQRSIDLDKDFIFSHIQLGVTQYKLGSVASSMATFRRCIKNFDRVPDVYNYYGELLLDQQNYVDAIEKFDTAVEMDRADRPTSMNVLPLINKALALYQWKQDFSEAEKLCQKALILDPECDIAVATMAQLLLQQGKVTEALKYFERAAELSRTEGEIVNALSYAEATRTQLEVRRSLFFVPWNGYCQRVISSKAVSCKLFIQEHFPGCKPLSMNPPRSCSRCANSSPSPLQVQERYPNLSQRLQEMGPTAMR